MDLQKLFYIAGTVFFACGAMLVIIAIIMMITMIISAFWGFGVSHTRLD